jgi:plastocyanin
MIKMTKLMTVTIAAISLATVGVFMSTNSDDGFSVFSWNAEQERQLAGVIQTANGYFAVPGFIATVEASNVVDEMFLTDEPGNWFKSTSLGGPLSIVSPGQAVEFDLQKETDSIHTVSLLVPAGKLLEIDQNRADDDKIRVQFDEPGVHLFACKVHPYMAGIVVVTDEEGNIPDVSAQDLPFIERLGAPSLPATTVASVLTNVAPFDDQTPQAFVDLGLTLDKASKWDVSGVSTNLDVDGDGINAQGVGEIWINAQFEAVDGQTDKDNRPKPGTITVLDASDFSFKQEIDGVTNGQADPNVVVNGENGWNNPHNMWANTNHDVVYNGHWFGQWLNLIERDNGQIKDTINVGYAPTHIVTNPNENSDEFGMLTLPLSAEEDILKIEHDGNQLHIEDKIATGANNNHPHGQWITADGSKILIPNVFQEGLFGSVTIMDTESGDIIREIQATDADGGNLLLPVAVGIAGSETGYISNIATGTVSVLDFDSNEIVNNIKVACFNPSDGGKCLTAADDSGIVLETLKLPIQTPPSPDGKWVATAVFSLVSQVNPDTIAIIDAQANGGQGALVAELDCPAGCHGVNWGAKDGGGYYAYVTSQHANILTVVDPDPNGDDVGTDAAIVAEVVLANNGPTGGVTDGTGGQGILPLPLVKDGWIQDTVEACEDGDCSSEVDDWINQLEPSQKDPSG